MRRILVATDGSEGADRAVDYAARWAKTDGAELLIVNIIGGYGLPDKMVRAFTHAQHAWLDELLGSLSAETLNKARDRAQSIGVTTIQLESRTGEVCAGDHRDRPGEAGRRHRRRQARRRTGSRPAARQRLAEAGKSFASSCDGRSLTPRRFTREYFRTIWMAR